MVRIHASWREGIRRTLEKQSFIANVHSLLRVKLKTWLAITCCILIAKHLLTCKCDSKWPCILHAGGPDLGLHNILLEGVAPQPWWASQITFTFSFHTCKPPEIFQRCWEETWTKQDNHNHNHNISNICAHFGGNVIIPLKCEKHTVIIIVVCDQKTL